MKFSIMKREPSYFFDNMHEDLSRFLRDTFGDLELTDKNNLPLLRTFRPALEIKENKKEYKIKIELPNVKKEDIDVEINEYGLLLKAESHFEKDETHEDIHTSEFRYGKFMRTIPLEHAIDTQSAKSEYKNGVLFIKLEKQAPNPKEETKKLKID